MNYDNVILGLLDDIENTTIKFIGNGNVLYIEKGVRLLNSNITFKGDNGLVYLSSSKNPYIVKISINTQSTVFIGSENYFNDEVLIISSETKNIFIGNDCLLSVGLVLRNADAHLIYDLDSRSRINNTKSIYVGDHVWVGQNVTLLKGTIIGSGSVIGAASVISNKIIESDSIWAGNPARKIKSGIFWSGECVHSWTKDKTDKFAIRDPGFSFKYDAGVLAIDELEHRLSLLNNSSDRLSFIKENFFSSKNRMFVPSLSTMIE